MKSKLRIDKNIVVQKYRNQITLFDSKNSTLLTFNETASFIFSNYNSGTTVSQIISLLIQKYDIDQKRATIEVEKVINKLKKMNIITS
jgi:hypothetical protein